MTRLHKRVALVIAVLLLATSQQVTFASTDIDQAVQALKQAPVYVQPGTEGTTHDTAGELQLLLNKGDNVVIVMFPAEDAVPTTESLIALAKQIDDALGGKHIVGLSVGDNVVAYSATMPAGVPADLMRRAESVSVNTTETLQTFISNVHKWQVANPNAEASQSSAKDNSSDFPWAPIGGGTGVLVAGALLITSIRRRQLAYQRQERFKLRSPDEVKDVLERLLAARNQIHDRALVATIQQLTIDTEAYFKRRTDKVQRSADAKAFERSLNDLERVLTRYVDIQNNHRYYDNATTLLRQGSEAVEGFAEFVLNSIKNGERSKTTEFNVDTKILSASRYR